MDISSHDQTALELFKVLINKGPLTLYSANTLSNMPIGTIHRHFKEMIRTEKIMVYQTSTSGRKKISYGPTVYGFVYFYTMDEELQKNLDFYFDSWIKNEKFVDDLVESGFDRKKIISDKKSKKTFEKFVYFYAGVEDQLNYLVKNLSDVPRDVRWFIGGFLLVRKQEYMQTHEELVTEIPGLRKDISNFLQVMIKSYGKLQKMNK
ncbi:MAG TPA: ArsR family transcriptional regulator [Candidatus Nitrosotalea sp.]|nr:ArsR family transcriptional regulator [Candidatus Nitrosotalea sp.]